MCIYVRKIIVVRHNFAVIVPLRRVQFFMPHGVCQYCDKQTFRSSLHSYCFFIAFVEIVLIAICVYFTIAVNICKRVFKHRNTVVCMYCLVDENYRQ